MPQPESVEVRYCENCGGMLGKKARFCTYCGSPCHDLLPKHEVSIPNDSSDERSHLQVTPTAPSTSLPTRKPVTFKRLVRDVLIIFAIGFFAVVGIIGYRSTQPSPFPDNLSPVRWQPSHPNNAMYYSRRTILAELERRGYRDVQFCYMRDSQILKPAAYTYLIHSCFNYQTDDGRKAEMPYFCQVERSINDRTGRLWSVVQLKLGTPQSTLMSPDVRNGHALRADPPPVGYSDAPSPAQSDYTVRSDPPRTASSRCTTGSLMTVQGVLTDASYGNHAGYFSIKLKSGTIISFDVGDNQEGEIPFFDSDLPWVELVPGAKDVGKSYVIHYRPVTCNDGTPTFDKQLSVIEEKSQ